MDCSDYQKILGIIPARYDSSRFPGKPLVIIHGKSMIRRVYEQAVKCGMLTKVIVATDDESILKHVMLSGGNAVMTARHHRSGTERCCEVVTRLAGEGETYDFIVNIQGDEPYIAPEQITQLANILVKSGAPLATLVKRITEVDDLENSNVVKVVKGETGNALFFSRSPIPFLRGVDRKDWCIHSVFYKHIGIYGYQPWALEKIVSLPPTFPEQAESLEQLRWLGNGIQIQTEDTEYESIAIDIPEDVLKIPDES